MAAILGMAAIGAWAFMTERIGYVATHGTSMNPVYYQGDLVFIAKADSYHVGQIVAYHGSVPGQRVLHRIIGGDGTAGFVMKGDNNESVDPLTPTTDEMIGRAVLHVPHGGRWLQPLLGPSGLGMLSFLVFGSGATAARTRRDIPRGRRKKKVRAMSGGGGSWATALVVLKAIGRLPPVLRAAAVIASALTVISLALGVLGWMKPIVEKQKRAPEAARSITYSYSAKVPKSPAYDSTTASSPDPIFRKLANRVDLRTQYVGPPGTIDMSAELTNATGWHTTIVLMKPKSFVGTRFDSTVSLDLLALTGRADAASAAIGAQPSDSVAIAITTSVNSGGQLLLSAPLQLQVDPGRMTLGGDAKMQADAGSDVKSFIVVPRELRVFGLSVMMASQARSYAILGLVGAVALAAMIFLITRRRMPLRTRAQIESRYPQLLVQVEPMPSPPGKPVVNVDNFPALVKLAEKYGQMILTWQRPEADDFVVRDEGITYRYRIPHDDPTLQNIELINRPTAAGSHRRKTSSSQVS